jgi:hypothetical protein
MALRSYLGEEEQQREEVGGDTTKNQKVCRRRWEIDRNNTLTLSDVGAFDASAISMSNLVKV